MLADVTDVITHAKFYVNLFRGLGCSDTPKFALLHNLVGRSNNSESTAVLLCNTYAGLLGIIVNEI